MLGKLATVSTTPPAASSTCPTSSKGAGTPAFHAIDAVQAHTYALRGIPASIKARVAQFTLAQYAPPSA